jgi:hypothetical protein
MVVSVVGGAMELVPIKGGVRDGLQSPRAS